GGAAARQQQTRPPPREPTGGRVPARPGPAVPDRLPRPADRRPAAGGCVAKRWSAVAPAHPAGGDARAEACFGPFRRFCEASPNCLPMFQPGDTVTPIGWAEQAEMLSRKGPPQWWICCPSSLTVPLRSEEHTSELQSRGHLV